MSSFCMDRCSLSQQDHQSRSQYNLLARSSTSGVFPCTARAATGTNDQALRGRFLIAGGAVELARTIKPAHCLAFQRRLQTGWIKAIIFDCIGVAHNAYLFKALHCPVQLYLYFLRKDEDIPCK